MTNLTEMTSEALLERQKCLEEEITANEEEIRFSQAELDEIYDELDKRKGQ